MHLDGEKWLCLYVAYECVIRLCRIPIESSLCVGQFVFSLYGHTLPSNEN